MLIKVILLTEKDPIALDVLISFNAFATMIQVFKRFPLFAAIKYLFAPVKKLSSLAEMESNTLKSVLRRIERRGNTPHPDLFEFVLGADGKPPTTKAELMHLGSVALQMMLAGFGPIGDWYYFTLFLLINAPECYKILTDEIRTEFLHYADINLQSTMRLHYLVACLEESLRMIANNSTGLPRYSSGALVDGHYIPKGVSKDPNTTIFVTIADYLGSRLPFRVVLTLSAEVQSTSISRCNFAHSDIYLRHTRFTMRHTRRTTLRGCLHSASALAPV